MGRRRAGGRETVDVDTAVAVDRFLSSPALSEATRRAYAADLRDFSCWLREQGLTLDDLDVRVLAAYTAELGRARRGLAPTTIGRRLSAVRSLARHALGPERVPDAALAPRRPRRLPETPALREVERAVDRVGRDNEPLALRNAALLELVYSCGLRSAEAVALDLGDVDLDREHVHVRGKGGKERLVPIGEEAAWRIGLWLRDGRPALVRGACDALFLSVRGKRGSTRACSGDSSETPTASATPTRRTCSREAQTCGRSRSCSATRRSRRRRSTATSTRDAFGACTTTPTRARRRRRAGGCPAPPNRVPPR